MTLPKVRYAVWGFVAMVVSHAVREKIRDTADGMKGALERMGYGS